ncbi:hypothetical protein B5S29_g2506 [[Candida] boidinii]|nr:hypothetical protein B5S29_g2506 [[Candida] boidinii]
MVSFSRFAASLLTLTSLATATNSISTNVGCEIGSGQLYPGYNCNIYSHKSSDKLGEDFFYSGYKNNAIIGSKSGQTGSPYYKGGQKNCFGVNLKYQTRFCSEFTAYYYADESGFHDISIDVEADVQAAIYVGNGGFDCCNDKSNNSGKKTDCVYGSWWKWKRGSSSTSSVYLEKGLYYPFRVVCSNNGNKKISAPSIKCPSGKFANTNSCFHYRPYPNNNKCKSRTISCTTSTSTRSSITPVTSTKTSTLPVTSTYTTCGVNQACIISSQNLTPGYNCKLYKQSSSISKGDDFFYSGYKSLNLLGSKIGLSGVPTYSGGKSNFNGLSFDASNGFVSEFTAYYYADESGYHEFSIDLDVDIGFAVYFGSGSFDCCETDSNNNGHKGNCVYGSWWKWKRNGSDASKMYLKKGVYYPVRIVCDNKYNKKIPSFNLKCPSGKFANTNNCFHYIPTNYKATCVKTTIPCEPTASSTPTPASSTPTPASSVHISTTPASSAPASSAPASSVPASSTPASSAPASSAPASSAPASSAPASSAPASSAPASSAPASSAPASSAPASSAPASSAPASSAPASSAPASSASTSSTPVQSITTVSSACNIPTDSLTHGFEAKIYSHPRYQEQYLDENYYNEYTSLTPLTSATGIPGAPSTFVYHRSPATTSQWNMEFAPDHFLVEFVAYFFVAKSDVYQFDLIDIDNGLMIFLGAGAFDCCDSNTHNSQKGSQIAWGKYSNGPKSSTSYAYVEGGVYIPIRIVFINRGDDALFTIVIKSSSGEAIDLADSLYQVPSEIPAGCSAPSGSATVPSGSESAPSGSATVPSGSESAPSGSATAPSGSESAPSSSASAPSGSASAPSGSESAPSGSATAPSGSASAPSGSATAPSGSATAPSGSESAPSGSATVPSGSESAPSGSASAPSGSASAPSGSATVPSGSASAPSGSATAPSGSATAPSGSESAPSGSESAPSGSATAPSGSATVPSGSESAPSGSASAPSGSASGSAPSGSAEHSKSTYLTTGVSLTPASSAPASSAPASSSPASSAPASSASTSSTPVQSITTVSSACNIPTDSLTHGFEAKIYSHPRYQEQYLDENYYNEYTSLTPLTSATGIPGAPSTFVYHRSPATTSQWNMEFAPDHFLVEFVAYFFVAKSDVYQFDLIDIDNGLMIFLGAGAFDCCDSNTHNSQKGSQIAWGKYSNGPKSSTSYAYVEGGVYIPIRIVFINRGDDALFTIVIKSSSGEAIDLADSLYQVPSEIPAGCSAPSGSATVPSGSESAPSGSATVPSGSESAPSGSATAPSGSESAPSSSASAPSGSASAPSGSESAPSGSATAPSGSASAPSGSATAPSGSATAPSGSESAPSGSATVPSGSESAPSGSASAPSGSASAPSGSATVPSGSASAPSGSATAPSGSATAPSGSESAPSGSASAPSGSATVPSGSATAPSGSASAPSGSESAPSGSATVPSGSATAPSGSATAPSGSESATSGSATVPSGSESAPSGSATAPSGSATVPSGSESAPSGSASAPSGSESAPSGSATAPSGSATVPSGSESAPSGSATAPSGSATVPSGSASAPSGSASTPSGSVSALSGSESAPSGSATAPSGSASAPPGSATAPSGSATLPSGSESAPSGSESAPSGSATVPSACPVCPSAACTNVTTTTTVEVPVTVTVTETAPVTVTSTVCDASCAFTTSSPILISSSAIATISTKNPSATAYAQDNKPCFHIEIPENWANFKVEGSPHDGFLWQESSIDLSADGVDVPENDYSLSFAPSIFALGYDETFSTAATVTACGTTTGDNVGYVYATFAVIASDNQAIVKKRNEGINTETTTTLTIGVALTDSTKARKRDSLNYDKDTLEGSGSKISSSMYLLFLLPVIMFLF